MRALDDALGKTIVFSLVTPRQYLLRGPNDIAVPATPPPWVRSLRLASGLPESPLEAWLTEWEAQGATRRLDEVLDAFRAQLAEKGRLDVLFVCTHNARRSQMAQVLATAAARHFGLSNVRAFSGGTEARNSIPIQVRAALKRVGFEGDLSSKKVDHPDNPKADFVAVMVCSDADTACPVVNGATRRLSLPYEDPRLADGTAEEHDRYDQRVEQIGRDLVWIFRQLAKR
jgi:protein-tyrosine-phosphatase